MEYANKDLCAELYKLKPEWEGVDNHVTLYEDENGNRIPYYDLGYLLRKLHPAGALLRWGVDFESRPDAGRDKWFICAMDDKIDIRFWSNSPEDAACSLAIKLIKEGIM